MDHQISDFESSWPELEPILDAVLDLPREEQLVRARQLCGEDPALIAKVTRLIRGLDPAHDLLGETVADAWPDLLLELEGMDWEGHETNVQDRQGERLGDYRIEGLIGRGGMGDVFLAHRADGAFEKQVAIKIARQRAEPLTRDRFSIEQRILADLDHPNIARLLDAGWTTEGLPFVVMEYIDGEPLDRFCTEHALGLETRLGLFLEACAAVDHAHRNLVIHRDLKPSNILVETAPGELGRVKLLDFGIAKLLDPHEAGISDTQTLRLTPDYAAPEQFLRGGLSTATDVYSLGVILFELLARRSPRDREECSPSIWIERVLQNRPPLPSERAEDPRLARRLRGDLDAIVLRALEPDPQDRYDGARALADDVERHLDGRPVSAREAHRLYRVGRFLRRHGFSVGAILLVFLSVLGAAWVAIRESQTADQERRQALAAAARAENISGFLVQLFDAWDPYRFRHGEVSAKDLLDLGTERAGKDLHDPRVRRELLLTLADVHLRLGLIDESEKVLDQVDLETEPGFEDEEYAELHRLRAEVASLRGDQAEAEGAFRRALKALEGSEAGDLDQRIEMLISLGDSIYLQGRHREAESIFRRALANAQAAGLREREASSLGSLAGVVHEGRRHDEALLRQALDIYRSPGVDDPSKFHATLNNLSILLINQGGWEEATQILEELADRTREFLGPNHPELARRLINLARLKIEEARFEAALDHLDEAEAIHRRIGSAELGIEPLALEINKGRALAELGEPRSIEILQRARQVFLQQLGDDHPLLLTVDVRLAEAFLRLEQPRAALETLGRWLVELDPENQRWADVLAIQGATLVALGRPDEAESILEQAEKDRAETLPQDAWRLAWIRLELATSRARLGRPDPFGGQGLEVLETLGAQRGPDHVLTRRARALLSELGSNEGK